MNPINNKSKNSRPLKKVKFANYRSVKNLSTKHGADIAIGMHVILWWGRLLWFFCTKKWFIFIFCYYCNSREGGCLGVVQCYNQILIKTERSRTRAREPAMVSVVVCNFLQMTLTRLDGRVFNLYSFLGALLDPTIYTPPCIPFSHISINFFVINIFNHCLLDFLLKNNHCLLDESEPQNICIYKLFTMYLNLVVKLEKTVQVNFTIINFKYYFIINNFILLKINITMLYINNNIYL